MEKIYHKTPLSGENLAGKEGFAATISSSAHILLDGPTDQAGVQQVAPSGIIESGGAASGDRVTVVAKGQTRAKAGANCAAMERCVAEYNTGEIIPMGTDADGDYTIGYFPYGATDGQTVEFWVDIQVIRIGAS